MTVEFIERELTQEELSIVHKDFDQRDIENGVEPNKDERFTVVISEKEAFLGCASGLKFHNWFYLTDLWVTETHRGQGLGGEMLKCLEKIVESQNCHNIYTWTTGYKSPEFYKKLNYKIFADFKDYYASGLSRVGFKKKI